MFVQGKANRTLIEEAPKTSTEQPEALVQQRTAALRSLSARLLRVQEEERRHLARELHDTTGQTLTALKIELANLEEHARDGKPASESLAQSRPSVSSLKTDTCGLKASSIARWISRLLECRLVPSRACSVCRTTLQLQARKQNSVRDHL